MSTKLFGTDGIRAKAGEFPLNAQTVTAIGQAIGEKLAGKILIGQDTRISSPWIFEPAEGRHCSYTIDDRRRRRDSNSRYRAAHQRLATTLAAS